MFIKMDYDYSELKQFVSTKNMSLYNLIAKNHQEDNFTWLVYKTMDGVALTPNEFDYFLSTYKELIIKELKLK